MLSNDVSHDAPAFVLFLFSLDDNSLHDMALYSTIQEGAILQWIKTWQYFRLFAAFKTLFILFLPHFR